MILAGHEAAPVWGPRRGRPRGPGRLESTQAKTVSPRSTTDLLSPLPTTAGAFFRSRPARRERYLNPLPARKRDAHLRCCRRRWLRRLFLSPQRTASPFLVRRSRAGQKPTLLSGRYDRWGSLKCRSGLSPRDQATDRAAVQSAPADRPAALLRRLLRCESMRETR